MSTILFAGKTRVGNTDVVRTRHLRMWAERGLIHIEDSRDNSYAVASVYDTLCRMKGISDMLGNSSEREMNSENPFDRAWRAEQVEMLEGMVEVVRRAKEQGMPSDASARRDRARRLPKTVVVPGYGGGM